MYTQLNELKIELQKAIEEHSQLSNERILEISRQVDRYIVNFYKEILSTKEIDLFDR